MKERFARFYEVVRQVPRGRVTTYGRVADLAGFPGAARQVGQALFASEPEDGVPWQRVINAQGRISLPHPEAEEQRQLLLGEGVGFKANGAVDLRLYGWNPV